MVRLEVDAVPKYAKLDALMLVVDAFGKMEALLPVAVKLDAVGVVVATT